MADNMSARILAAMDHAEKEAWNALARYKFYMAGYWEAEWVKLNQLGQFKRPNPFGALVKVARSKGYGPAAGSVESLEASEEPIYIPGLLAAMSPAPEQVA